MYNHIWSSLYIMMCSRSTSYPPLIQSLPSDDWWSGAPSWFLGGDRRQLRLFMEARLSQSHVGHLPSTIQLSVGISLINMYKPSSYIGVGYPHFRKPWIWLVCWCMLMGFPMVFLWFFPLEKPPGRPWQETQCLLSLGDFAPGLGEIHGASIGFPIGFP